MTPESLDALLETAGKASPGDRISWRDPIAEHGARAIPAMQRWLSDPQLGAFAVRVLDRIAKRHADRAAAIGALRSPAAPSSGPIARDIAEALGRLAQDSVASGRSSSPRRDRAGHWAGYAGASPLEQRFHDDMLDIFRLAGEATRKRRPDGSFIRGYWASYFLRGVRNHGGVAYAHQLLEAAGTTAGFARLTEEGRLDLTMEALVLRPEYASLFTPRERQTAASRLARAGYRP